MSNSDPFADTAGMGRRLTEGEIKFLTPIFCDTLPYSRIRCHSMAGPSSITPTGNPYFSRSIYFDDFSKIRSDEPKLIDALWTLIHELTHVWQYYHGINVVGRAIATALTERYQASYKYTLQPHKSIFNYKIEQQASIVADRWLVSNRYLPACSQNKLNARLSDYDEAIKTLQQSGLPRMPIFPKAPEFQNSDAN